MNTEISYAEKVREEIFGLKPVRLKNYKSFCYGLLLMSKQFDQNGISLSTEHLSVSKLYGFAVRDCCDIRPTFALVKKPRGVEIYTASLDNKSAITKLMDFFEHTENVNRELLDGDNFSAFLTGTFLACGSVSEPEKGYHLEFVPPNDELCDLLFEILAMSGYPAKSSRRRKQTVLYFKESTQIEDILTMMGAIKCSLELMETKIYKDFRNRVNRATNCETANIDKLVKAASSQREDIRVLEESGELKNLTPLLQEMAKIRGENPELSLAQLAEILGISRSGINYRLKQIAIAAQRVRERSL